MNVASMVTQPLTYSAVLCAGWGTLSFVYLLLSVAVHLLSSIIEIMDIQAIVNYRMNSYPDVFSPWAQCYGL